MNPLRALGALVLSTTLLAAVPAEASVPAREYDDRGTQVQLGQAGEGYLVRHRGGDRTVLYERDGGLVPATEPARPPIDGRRTRTWVTAAGQLRSERTGAGGARRVWSWEVAGPGEGGEVDPHAPAWGTLVATRIS
jgi:hypothetical protein